MITGIKNCAYFKGYFSTKKLSPWIPFNQNFNSASAAAVWRENSGSTQQYQVALFNTILPGLAFSYEIDHQRALFLLAEALEERVASFGSGSCRAAAPAVVLHVDGVIRPGHGAHGARFPRELRGEKQSPKMSKAGNTCKHALP